LRPPPSLPKPVFAGFLLPSLDFLAFACFEKMWCPHEYYWLQLFWRLFWRVCFVLFFIVGLKPLFPLIFHLFKNKQC
jgi:hypothetical protein